MSIESNSSRVYQPQSLSELLLHVSARVRTLSAEATALIDTPGDEYLNTKRKIGTLVLSLPDRLSAFREAGNTVPGDVESVVAGLVDLANQGMQSPIGFPLGVAMLYGYSQEAGDDDPDQLQILAAKYEADSSGV